MRSAVGRLHNAGASAGGHDETAAPRGDVRRPLGQQMSQAARVLVIARHVNGRFGALHVARLLRCGHASAVVAHIVELIGGRITAGNARRAKKYHGVLNLLAAEARQRFDVFRQQAQDAAVGRGEKRFVVVRQRGGLQLRFSHRRSVVGRQSSVARYSCLRFTLSSSNRPAGAPSKICCFRGPVDHVQRLAVNGGFHSSRY